jgi:hypothetical protein
MKKNVLKQLTSQIKASVVMPGLNNRHEITAFTLGVESDSATREHAESGRASLEAIVSSTIDMVLGTENEKITEAQRKAAISIASLAIDPTATMRAMKSFKTPVDAKDALTIGAESYLDGIVDNTSLSLEAFDGQDLSNALYASIAYNIGAAKQDEFGEAFFPTIVIDPLQSGMLVEMDFASVISEYQRSITGATNDNDAFGKSLVKTVYNSDVFGNDKTSLVPVLRPENKALLLDTYSFAGKSLGSDVTTAPIRFGVAINLLGVSQTDASLAKGIMDNTDSLDRTLNVENIYFSLTGQDSKGNTVVDMIKANIKALPYSNFTNIVQNHNKELGLQFKTDAIKVTAGTTKTVDGALSNVLSAQTAGTEIVFRVQLNGNANTSTGSVTVFGSAIEVIGIFNASGAQLAPTSDEYKAIAGSFTAKLEGYTVEAYVTNSNLRTRGIILQANSYKQLYMVPMRSGISVMGPVNAVGADNDISKVTSQIQAINFKTSVYAVETLLSFAESLASLTANGKIVDSELHGVSRHIVNPYFSSEAMPLNQYVDSSSSNERSADISAALENYIRNKAYEMYTTTNYNVANAAARGLGDSVVDVIIGTDPQIAGWLINGRSEADINLGKGFRAKVVASPHVKVAGKIFITFGVFDDTRNTVPNPLNFGQMAWAPTLSIDVQRSQGGATVRELWNVPRFSHIINLPILAVVTVTDINSVIGKVAAFRKNQVVTSF